MARPPKPRKSDRSTCTKCGREKALSAFVHRPLAPGQRPPSWCRACKRLYDRERYRLDHVQAKRRAYLERPDVQARRSEWSKARARLDSEKARKRRYYQSLPGRLKNALSCAKWCLEHAKTPRGKAGALRRIELLHTEIQRLERSMKCGN